MRRRRTTTPLWAILAAFLLRAIVPAGYMPAALAGGLPFVPCPGFAIGPVAAAAEAGHHGASHGTHEGSAAKSFEACPFGAIPVAAAPAPPLEPALPVPDRDEPAALPAPLAVPTPVLAQSRPRAPPPSART